MTEVRGTVINVHHHGATVRLEDGGLAAVAALELAAHRAAYVASLERRRPLALYLDRHGRHRTVALAPAPAAPPARPASDVAFEAKIGAYLKATLEWAPADRVAPAERHFIRKKRRARLFEARTDPA